MAIRAVADTHAGIWYLYDDPRLSAPARAFMDSEDAAGDQIVISSITLAEMVYLIEKGRIDPTAMDRVLSALDRPDPLLVEAPLDRKIVQAMRALDRTEVPELPDRVVAATALHLGVPVISRDQKIRTSKVTTVW
jgi:PIN domain nuclease of toxin-antitoxin system